MSTSKVTVFLISTIVLGLCNFGISPAHGIADSAVKSDQVTTQQNSQSALLKSQQQASGSISGHGTSEVTGGVCTRFRNNDFLTLEFHASFLLSTDGKTGQVTSGSGILKTTYSNVFGYLSITGGNINTGVQPGLYSLKGTATFQSLSSSLCNLPSTVEFSIAKPDGTQLRCGNIDLITFNSIPLTGSVRGSVTCTHTASVGQA